MGDVTYGACCVDDFTARALGADFLVHYGHSCLIPVNQTTGIKMLYVFVDIKFDLNHFVETIKLNFTKETSVAFVSTIQFVSSLQAAAIQLKNEGHSIIIPKSSPLSPGEILGCTSPTLQSEVIVYLGDGRFHLESAMIANPTTKAFKYDPYSKEFTQEFYEHEAMKKNRLAAVNVATKSSKFGLILGTLGRQGSPKVMVDIKDKLKKSDKVFFTILMSEIFPAKLKLMPRTEAQPQYQGGDRNKSTIYYVLALGVFVGGFSYAAVPLYRLFCQSYSYGGTTSAVHNTEGIENLKPNRERVLRIRFNADTSSNLTWNFKPQQSEIKVALGETALAFYTATNPTDRPIDGVSTYNVIPFDAGQYFNKIQCFCFEEQRLNPHEQVDMPVFFYIDPDFGEDPKMESVESITLSYTFFEAKEGLNLVKPEYAK
uniref:2-(3-amino-3-carboxypropyl)histidine synthase subunit 1 n=1 Tax=Evadne anonyx TaxID=141404 RepID=A0A9N6WTI6_9CRUS|nr:EOG090X0GO2 [Evadne anonyx]